MKKFNYFVCVVIVLSLLSCCFVSCKKDEEKLVYEPIAGIDPTESTTLRIAISTETNKALDLVVNEFNSMYPNVQFSIEKVDSTLVEKSFIEDTKDIVFTSAFAYSESKEDYFYDFAQDLDINLSYLTDDITNNYLSYSLNEDETRTKHLYAIPMGGEVRGLFVNKTLLNKFNLQTPKTWEEFLVCCQTLKENGYIPIQGNPGFVGNSLTYADAIGDFVFDEEKFNKVKNLEEGVGQIFEDSFSKLYTLATNRYYDYKYVEEVYKQFKASSALDSAKSFLGLIKQDDFSYAVQENEKATAAFFPYLSSESSIIDKLIDEYALDFEYEFILSPMNEAGTNPVVYFTPAEGIAISKNSSNLKWAKEFINFMFFKTTNELYADNAGIIANNKDIISNAANRYNVTKNDVVLCGTVNFVNDKNGGTDPYNFNAFNPISTHIANTSKVSAQKYMVKLEYESDGVTIKYRNDEDGKGNYLLTDNGSSSVKIYEQYIGAEDSAKPGYAFCTLSYFLDGLENGSKGLMSYKK